MPPKKLQPDASRCPQCGTPLQEAAYRWNPARGDFDVFVSCPHCTPVEASPPAAPRSPTPAAATRSKPRK